MVSSVARGQFRVTGACGELTSTMDQGYPEEAGQHDDGLAEAQPTAAQGPLPIPGLDRFELRPVEPPSSGEEPRTEDEETEPTEETEPAQPGPPPSVPPRQVVDLPEPRPPASVSQAGEGTGDEPTEEKERSGARPTAEPTPPAEGPPSQNVGAPLTEQPAPVSPEGTPAPTPAVSRSAIMSRPARGPLRVTAGWPELLPTAEPPPTPPPAGEPSVPRGTEAKAPTPPAVQPSEPEPTPLPLEAEAASPVAPPTAAPSVGATTDPSRVLVSLLARMWLMRTSGATAGGLALAPPPPPAAPPAPPPAVSPAPPAPPPEPLPPPPSPQVSAPEPTPPAAPLLTAPDIDDRRPLSGLATFLVQVAELSHPAPPPAEPALPTPPVAVLSERVRVVFRLVHCRHPIPERPVSRDACRLSRVGR